MNGACLVCKLPLGFICTWQLFHKVRFTEVEYNIPCASNSWLVFIRRTFELQSYFKYLEFEHTPSI